MPNITANHAITYTNSLLSCFAHAWPHSRIKGFLIPPSGTWIPDSNTRQRDSFGFLKLNFGVQDFKARDSGFHK